MLLGLLNHGGWALQVAFIVGKYVNYMALFCAQN
jgi:hypothetical protein